METVCEKFGLNLGKPIIYYPFLEGITGNTVSALFLSGMLPRAAEAKHADGWFRWSRDEVRSWLGLSRRRQDSSRRILRRLDLIEEKHTECPRRLYYRLRLDRLKSLVDEKMQENQQCVRNVPTGGYEMSPLEEKNTGKMEKVQENQQCVRNVPTGGSAYVFKKTNNNLNIKYPDNNTHSAFRRKAYEKEITDISVNCNSKPSERDEVVTGRKTTSKKSSAKTASLFKSDAGASRSKSTKRAPNPAVKRLVDWYYDSWKGMPPEKLNGNGAGRIAKIFSDLLECLASRKDLSVTPEEYIRELYDFYRSTKPSSRNEHWLFGEDVKSLVRFRGKFAYIEGKYSGRKSSKSGLAGMKPSVKKDWGVSSGMLRRNKRPLFADMGKTKSNNRVASER